MAASPKSVSVGRHVNPEVISVPPGFRIEAAATGLDIPSGVDFDAMGNVFIAEMGSVTASAYRPGRIVTVRTDGTIAPIADGFSGAVTGLCYIEGAFYVTEHAPTGRVWRVFEDGTKDVVVDSLPGGGDHATSMVVYSHSGRIYFGQGTRTNSGVVGPDNKDWLTTHPDLCDVPGADVILVGRNFESPNVLSDRVGTRALTGSFRPFGVPCSEGEVVPGDMLCSGSILRADADGGGLELFAWGLRRPFGLAVHPDGRIFCTDVGMEPRGSRPVADAKGRLWELHKGGWYGWPDFAGGEPVTDSKFKPRNGLQPDFLMKEHPPLSGKPVATFPVGSGIAKFDFARSLMFGSEDTAFVALSGDLSGNGDHGFKVVRVDVANGFVDDFVTNKHPGPGSACHSGGLERPSDVRFDRTGEVMYILDMGVVQTTSPRGAQPLPNSGVLWRVTWVG